MKKPTKRPAAKPVKKPDVSKMTKSQRAEYEASKYPLTDCPDWMANKFGEITVYLIVINGDNVVAAELCRHLATLVYWNWKADHKSTRLVTKNVSLLPEGTPEYVVYDGDVEDHHYRSPEAAAAVAELRRDGSVFRMTSLKLPKPE